MAAVGDPVIGIITMRLSEAYRVDIAEALPATLDHLAFQGATKRNKPDLKVCFYAFIYSTGN